MEFSWSAIGGLYTHSTMVSKKTREVIMETRMVLWKPAIHHNSKKRGLAKNQEAKHESLKGGDL